MFRNALDQTDLRSKSMATVLSAQESKLVLDTFLFNNRNVETMLDRDVVPLLFHSSLKEKSLKKRKLSNHFWADHIAPARMANRDSRSSETARVRAKDAPNDTR